VEGRMDGWMEGGKYGDGKRMRKPRENQSGRKEEGQRARVLIWYDFMPADADFRRGAFSVKEKNRFDGRHFATNRGEKETRKLKREEDEEPAK
jgi:hypothetical protein